VTATYRVAAAPGPFPPGLEARQQGAGQGGGAGPAGGAVWQGQVATGAVEIEIKPKGAAGVKGGQAVAGLSLRLVAAKTRYAGKEPLELRVFLDNVGPKRLTVLKRTSHVDLGIEAYDAERRFIVSLLPPSPPPALAAGDLAPLAAGASLELKNWELLRSINHQIKVGHGRTGRFTIRAVYRAQSAGDRWNVRKLDADAWAGTLKSNPVEVVIAEAGGAAAPGGGEWQDLFAGENWYRNQPGAERVFSGKLVGLAPAGETALQRTSHYRLGDRTIYTGARKLPALEALVGKSVEIRGKAVDMALEGQNLKEIWPAAVREAK
jgi:hypothetical protein